LTRLKVSGNEATQHGGGLFFDTCSPIIQDISVTNNHAGKSGGGISFAYGSPELRNVVVAGNSTGEDGGGLVFYHADAKVTNTLVADNSGSGKGGGIHFDGCSPTFVNVTVAGNSTTKYGGGLDVSYMSQPTLVNSIVWGNSPEQIYFDTDWPGEAVTIEYSSIQGGEGAIVTNGLGPVYWGDGNMDASPLFVNADQGDYHLADGSPCLNAGKAASAPLTDIEGNPRPDPPESNPDMGAYESR
jgi:predicted outer membrane repeat protein